jgi:hypothetical protein
VLSVDDILAPEDAELPGLGDTGGGGDPGPPAEASGVAPSGASPAFGAGGGGAPVVDMASLVPTEPEAGQAV